LYLPHAQGHRHEFWGGGVWPKPGHTKTTPQIKNSPDLIYYFLKKAHFSLKILISVKKMGSSAFVRGDIPPVSPTGGTYPPHPPGGDAPAQCACSELSRVPCGTAYHSTTGQEERLYERQSSLAAPDVCTTPTTRPLKSTLAAPDVCTTPTTRPLGWHVPPPTHDTAHSYRQVIHPNKQNVIESRHDKQTVCSSDL